jgi:hypothetical protein
MKTKLQTPTRRTTLTFLAATVACAGAFLGRPATSMALFRPPVMTNPYIRGHAKPNVLRPAAAATRCPVRELLSVAAHCSSATTTRRKPRRVLSGSGRAG